MKILYLINSRIKQYWKNHKTILAIFLIGSILNSIVFSYLYGNLVAYMISRDSTESYYREYQVFCDHSTITIDNVQKIYESGLFISVMPCSRVSVQDYKIVAEINDMPTIVCEKGSINLKEVENAVIIPSYVSGNVGDLVNILGNEFTVIGQHTISGYYISFEQFKSLNPPIDTLYLLAKDRQDFSNDKVYELLKESFPSSDIRTPQRYETHAENTSVDDIYHICVVYAIALCSYMFLLRYLMDSMLNYTIISFIVGGTKKRIFTILLLEVMILCSVANALGITLHHLLYPYIFSHINLSKGLTYGFYDYALIFTLMQLVGLVVAIPFTIKYSKLSPVESKGYID